MAVPRTCRHRLRLAKLFGNSLQRPIEAKPEVRANFIKENIDKFRSEVPLRRASHSH